MPSPRLAPEHPAPPNSQQPWPFLVDLRRELWSLWQFRQPHW